MKKVSRLYIQYENHFFIRVSKLRTLEMYFRLYNPKVIFFLLPDCIIMSVLLITQSIKLLFFLM